MVPISVIIPSYNGAKLLHNCLHSLALQTRKPSEIIVVDNGSSDETAQIVNSSHLDVYLIKLPCNEGFSKAINKGIQKSQSELVLVLNNDVRLDSKCIESLQIASLNKSYSSFAPLIFSHEELSVHSAGLMFSNRGYGNRSNCSLYSVHSERTDIFSPCGAAALYRRSALEDVGLFNENFFLFFEDLELGFRLQLRGHRCLLVPAAKAFHIGGATARRFFPIKVEQTIINSITTLLSCVPFEWIAVDSLRTIYFYSVLILNCCKRGYYNEVVCAIKSIIKNLPRTFSYRKKIQLSANYEKKYLRQMLYTGAIQLNFIDEAVIVP